MAVPNWKELGYEYGRLNFAWEFYMEGDVTVEHPLMRLKV